MANCVQQRHDAHPTGRCKLLSQRQLHMTKTAWHCGCFKQYRDQTSKGSTICQRRQVGTTDSASLSVVFALNTRLPPPRFAILPDPREQTFLSDANSHKLRLSMQIALFIRLFRGMLNRPADLAVGDPLWREVEGAECDARWNPEQSDAPPAPCPRPSGRHAPRRRRLGDARAPNPRQTPGPRPQRSVHRDPPQAGQRRQGHHRPQ